jgi:hypothetical protein
MASMEDITPLQRALLDMARHCQLFAVVSWGCAATKWLAKVLNSHPEILCIHAGNGALARFSGPIDSLKYFHVLSLLGQGYKAVGDVHGLPRRDLSKLKETFGDRFNAAIVVREPMARLRSQMALYRESPGLGRWDLSYLDPLIASENLEVNCEESRMFVHAANMLNAIAEEIPCGPIYKAEDLTVNPDILAGLIVCLSAGRIVTDREWLERCLSRGKVNAHAKREAVGFTDWEVGVLRAVVRPESWRMYQNLGYLPPSFVAASATSRPA